MFGPRRASAKGGGCPITAHLTGGSSSVFAQLFSAFEPVAALIVSQGLFTDRQLHVAEVLREGSSESLSGSAPLRRPFLAVGLAMRTMPPVDGQQPVDRPNFRASAPESPK